MDLTRLAVDAGQFINRAVQYTGESLGQAEKSGLDPDLERLLARAESTKTWTDRILSQTEILLQPSLGARLEDRLYERLEWSVPPRPRAHDLLGDQMTRAGLEIGSNTPYGAALVKVGETQKQLGEAERKFVKSTNIHFLAPLRGFTEGEHRVLQNEQKMLLNKRLDLDIAKSRLRKAQEADRESRTLNAAQLEDDYVSHVSYMFSFLRVKWLKTWAQEVSQLVAESLDNVILQAEMELRICQSLFDRQAEITRRVVEGISSTHTSHMRSLLDFVDAQSSYFAQCDQRAQDLQQQLCRIPAVLCSNNWQAALHSDLHQPSASRAADSEPPTPRGPHQPPDFNQDSSASSSATLPAANTNKNNNNVSAQANRDQLAVKRRLFASQTLVFQSNQTEDLEEGGGTCGSAGAVSVSVNNNTAGETTTAAAPPPSQTNPAWSTSQAADPEAAGTPTSPGASLKDCKPGSPHQS